MMSLVETLSTVGLIRPTRRRGFCPACRHWAAPPTRQTHLELAPPGETVLMFLVVAAAAWWFTVQRSSTMGGMAMAPETLGSFAASWVVMMAAMMLPSAMPLVFEFGRSSEGRSGWQAATGILGATYLAIWLAFGIACYFLVAAFPASWVDHRSVGAAAFGLAGLYGLTPIKRASEARCREVCALHGSLPFDLMRSAMVVGAKYGLSCVGCSAALMVAMVIIGMSNLGWIVVLSGLVLVYKLGPAPTSRRTILEAGILVTLGVAYVLMA